MRRQFQLAEEDEACLTARSPNWEAIVENNTKWVIVPDFTIPEGYNQRTASAAMRILPSYPDDQIDMVYFFPPLERTDRHPIATISSQLICGETYQRWSRHRTSANPWRPGVDDISTHVTLVDEWLRRELTR